MSPSAEAAELRVDALIVTAVSDEYEAVVAVDTGAVAGSKWTARKVSTGLDISIRPFCTTEGVLTIAVTQALGIGGVEAVSASAQLIPLAHPRSRELRRHEVGLYRLARTRSDLRTRQPSILSRYAIAVWYA